MDRELRFAINIVLLALIVLGGFVGAAMLGFLGESYPEKVARMQMEVLERGCTLKAIRRGHYDYNCEFMCPDSLRIDVGYEPDDETPCDGVR